MVSYRITAFKPYGADKKMKKIVVTFLFCFLSFPALAGSSEGHNFPYTGIFGKYDHTSLQNGFDIYRKSCSKCGAFSYFRFRDLETLGIDGGEIDSLLLEYNQLLGGEFNKNDFIPPLPGEDQGFVLPDKFDTYSSIYISSPSMLFDRIFESPGCDLSEDDVSSVVEFINFVIYPYVQKRKKTGLAVTIYLLIFFCVVIFTRNSFYGRD